jgi:FkbM family methyltransferase
MADDLVYDVGMNNGDDTAYYLWCGFRTIAIEANPELVEQAKVRFAKEIAEERLILLNIGITASEGELPFWVCEKDSRMSSFNQANATWDGSSCHQIKIPCFRFRTILAQYGIPFFCKIDIQGNDFLCLQDFEPHKVPKFLSVEADDPRLLEMLAKLGYSLFKLIKQYSFTPIQFPPVAEQITAERVISWLHSPKFRHRVFRKLGGRRWLQQQIERARCHNGWSFPMWTSSGPFGDQILGRWLTYEEMNQTYGEFWRRRNAALKSKCFKRYSFWADLHAQYVRESKDNN